MMATILHLIRDASSGRVIFFRFSDPDAVELSRDESLLDAHVVGTPPSPTFQDFPKKKVKSIYREHNLPVSFKPCNIYTAKIGASKGQASSP